MTRQLIKEFPFVAFTAALLLTAGCKIPITVTSNPPGARAYVGPMNGSVWIVDAEEKSSREQYAGETPVTVRSFYAWNEGGHAWAHVEWPDGTRSTVKFRKPHPFGFSAATFDFNKSDYAPVSSPNSTPAPTPLPISATSPKSTSPSPPPAPVTTQIQPAPAAATSLSAAPSSPPTAADLIGMWQNDGDTNELLIIHPDLSATWQLSGVKNDGYINLVSDNQIRFDYHDRAFNKNNSLNWKIIDGRTISINRYGQEETFHHQ